MAFTETKTRPAPRVEPTRRRGRWIDHWDPEDPAFWAGGGNQVARRNLVWSILAEHVGFSVWLLWSAVVVFLPAAGFAFSVNQLFWLVALPNLVGATMRFPYTFAVARFGGRNWTVVSALLLLVPLTLLVLCVTNPGTPYSFFLVAAATSGFPPCSWSCRRWSGSRSSAPIRRFTSRTSHWCGCPSRSLRPPRRGSSWTT